MVAEVGAGEEGEGSGAGCAGLGFGEGFASVLCFGSGGREC